MLAACSQRQPPVVEGTRVVTETLVEAVSSSLPPLLTTAASGDPTGEPVFTVTNYTVAALDDLIVRIVTGELAAINP
ncbi:MAG: hypothetical protein BroJett015_08410 [Chloroflexota bacterium]|nr:MAG: hypothetical protein BroJett015_08410 [Chloroflexota bacterium]